MMASDPSNSSNPSGSPSGSVASAADAIQALGAGEDKDLCWYHAVGSAMRTIRKGYGTGRLAKVAEELKHRRVPGLDVSMLRKCDAFARRLTQQQARQLADKDVSWRAGVQLANQQLTDSQFNQLVQRVVSGDLTPADLPKAIAEALGGQRDLTPVSLQAAVRHANTNIDLLARFVRDSPC